MKTTWCLLKLSLLFFSLWACPRIAHAYYAPGIQRWINRDPINESGFQSIQRSHKAMVAITETESLLIFVHNNPINKLDPDGRSAEGGVAGVTAVCATICGIGTQYNIKKIAEVLEAGECVDYAPKCYKIFYAPLGLKKVFTICRDASGNVTVTSNTVLNTDSGTDGA